MSEIEPQFKKLTRYPVLAVGLSMAGFIMIKTGRDAVFFRDSQIDQLPLAYIWIALLALPISMIHLRAIDHWGNRKARTGTFFLAALIFLGFTPWIDANHQNLMMGLFVFVPTLFAAVFAGAWLLAGDLLEEANAQTKRWAYSRIGAASMIGGIVGGLIGRQTSDVLSAGALVGMGALVLAIVGVLVHWVHRNHPIEQSNTEPSSGSPMAFLQNQIQTFKQPYLGTLLGVSGLAVLTGLLIDFQFYASTVKTGNNNARFFADFYIILNATSLVLQLLIAPKLQAKLGVGGALTVLPAVLLGGAGLVSVWSSIEARAILRVTEGGIKASIHRAIWEQVFLPVPRERREMVKAVVDGMFARMAEGLGSIGLYAWLWFTPAIDQLPLQHLSWIILIILIAWIALTRHLNRLGCADIDPTDPHMPLPDSCPCVAALGKNKRR